MFQLSQVAIGGTLLGTMAYVLVDKLLRQETTGNGILSIKTRQGKGHYNGRSIKRSLTSKTSISTIV